MTDPALLIIDHKNALLNRIKEDTILAKCGFEGVVLPDPVTKKRPERYWTVFTDSGARFTDRLAGMSTSANLMYWFHCVGTTPEQAQLVAGRLIAKLVDYTPTVAGYAPFRVRHVASEPLRMDADVKNTSGEVLHYTVDQFSLATQSVPA